MTDMTVHKNEVGQASSNGGEFAAKTHTEAPADLLVAEDADARKNIATVCAIANEQELMVPVFGWMLDGLDHRDDNDIALRGALEQFTEAEVKSAYRDFIEDAVDKTRDYLTEYAPAAVAMSRQEILDGNRAALKEAGLPDVLIAVLERASEDDAVLRPVSPTHGRMLFDTIVEDSCVELVDDIRLEHCTQCGYSLDDGQGFDGLCGNCADVAEGEGRWD